MTIPRGWNYPLNWSFYGQFHYDPMLIIIPKTHHLIWGPRSMLYMNLLAERTRQPVHIRTYSTCTRQIKVKVIVNGYYETTLCRRRRRRMVIVAVAVRENHSNCPYGSR